MKYFDIKILVFLLLFLAGCSQDQDDIFNVISATGEQWVPDKREGVFDISYQKVKAGTYVLQGETNIEEAREELVNKLTEKGFQIQDSIRLLPSDLVNKWGLATLSVVSLRTIPSHSAELSNQALMGTPVQILKKKDGWLYVQTPDKYLAWCEKDALVRLSEEELDLWRNSQRVIVLKSNDFILKENGEMPVSDVVAGCILKKVSENNGNVLVSLPDNRTGILSNESVVDFNDWQNRPLPDSAKLVKTALSMLGTPYLWGANSTKTLDCSGFTKTIYFLNGIILARDASLQALHGTKLELDNQNFLPGDLLFFGKPDRITHVAMYIGNSEYIHSAGRVKINSLDKSSEIYSDYRKNSMQSARRVIDNGVADGIITVSEHPWY